ncbi:MAG: biopolymer transporter ExbD [Bacteroidetes bacterium]|nr:biopolymer transporter ExbD [Bacteroidota bacterium]
MARKIPEINSGSMADISFLLLTFFLLTSSINTDKGISRKLSPYVEAESKSAEVKKRNIMIVLVNANNQLMVNGNVEIISNLKSKVIDFLANPANSPELPEKAIKNIDLLGNVQVSKGVISLQSDRGTSYETYVKIQDELSLAYTELRNRLSREKFGRKFDDLKSEAKMEAIQKAIPINISETEPKNTGGNK